MTAQPSRQLVEAALERIGDTAGEGRRTFLRTDAEGARRAADAADGNLSAGRPVSGIAGLPVSIKDLLDAEGQVTTAGSPLLKGAPAAARDCTVVQRLKRAGAAIIGRTNMTEFAFTGVGINPHFGTPANPYDRARRRIPGGSSSGAAVSVTDGMCIAAIGSDTGGSVRIPAALCGIAGFKPTQRRVPLDGVFPLSPTLDSVGVLARNVALCAAFDAVLAGEPADEPARVDLTAVEASVSTNYFVDGLDAAVAHAFERALSALSAAGLQLKETTFPEVAEIATVNGAGGFAAAEAYAWHQSHGTNLDGADPLVKERILRGETISAAHVAHMHHGRAEIMERFERAHASIDVILCPTVPIAAPEIRALEEDADLFRRVNAQLLRNPSAVNFLGRCALTIPCQGEGEAPVGLMLIGRPGEDRGLLAVGRTIEEILKPKG